MKYRALRAAIAALVLAGSRLAAAQFEDGSEADVLYYAADENTAPTRALLDEAAGPTDLDVLQDDAETPFTAGEIEQQSATAFEPGVYDSDACSLGCEDNCQNQCAGTCGGRGRFWGRGEYLMWFLEGTSAPPLVTTSPDGTPQAQAGVLPDATILFPTENFGTNGRPGGRFTLGYWMDPCETVGFQGSYFFLDKSGNGFSQTSDDTGSPILARPFYNTQTNQEDSSLVSFPDIVAGTINVATSSDVLGAEANFRKAVWSDGNRRIDLLGGYRFFQLHESVNVYERQVSIDPGGVIPLGTVISIADEFGTKNEFHGGQIGFLFQKNCRRWSFDALGKVALGNMNQRINIAGLTAVTVPLTPTVVEEGGLLALASNSGLHERNKFAAIPEFGANLHYQLTDIWRINVGYTWMYIPHVVRAGSQIDRRLDPDQFPPPLASGIYPQFNFRETNVWLQGVNVGIECRF